MSRLLFWNQLVTSLCFFLVLKHLGIVLKTKLPTPWNPDSWWCFRSSLRLPLTEGGSFQCTTSSETSLLPAGLQEGTRLFSHHTETMRARKLTPGLKRQKNTTLRQEHKILLMVQKSGDHQLRLVVYPIIYRVLYIPGGAGFLNHQQYVPRKTYPCFENPQKMLKVLVWSKTVGRGPRICLRGMLRKNHEQS